MSAETETAPPPAAESHAAPFSTFDAAMAGMDWDTGTDSTSPAATPAAPAEAAPPPAVEKPEDAGKADDPPAAADPNPAPKPGSFKALKIEKEKEKEEALAALRTEYEGKLAALQTSAGQTGEELKTWQEKLAAAEALKVQHEARIAELETNEINAWETPYSLEVDPEALPALRVANDTRQALDAAVNHAATSLGEDARAVNIIAANKVLFARLMGEMSRGLAPDATHATTLVAELAKLHVAVGQEEARAVVRDLKGFLPKLGEFMSAQRTLTEIKARNEPNWTQAQAARHEAYRRHVLAQADVPETAEGETDDALLAGILKEDPSLKDVLKTEADRLSSLVLGPAPGKRDVNAIRATPRQLHETAVKAARLPVIIKAYRGQAAKLTEQAARIAELEARIAGTNNTVPRPGASGGTTTPPPARSFAEGLKELFPDS